MGMWWDYLDKLHRSHSRPPCSVRSNTSIHFLVAASSVIVHTIFNSETIYWTPHISWLHGVLFFLSTFTFSRFVRESLQMFRPWTWEELEEADAGAWWVGTLVFWCVSTYWCKVGNSREWSTITMNNHPSHPQQPIHSLRLAPVSQHSWMILCGDGSSKSQKWPKRCFWRNRPRLKSVWQTLSFGHIPYPLVNVYIAIENGHLYWIYQLKWWFSIVTLVYQRVTILTTVSQTRATSLLTWYLPRHQSHLGRPIAGFKHLLLSIWRGTMMFNRLFRSKLDMLALRTN